MMAAIQVKHGSMPEMERATLAKEQRHMISRRKLKTERTVKGAGILTLMILIAMDALTLLLPLQGKVSIM